jgi:hypothetical protein
VGTREAQLSSTSLILTRSQTQSVDNTSIQAKHNGTAVSDSPDSESSDTGSVIHVGQSLNTAVRRKRVAVRTRTNLPVSKAKSNFSGTEHPEIPQLPDGYSSRPPSSPPQSSYTKAKPCGTPQVEAPPQTATHTGFPVTDDVVSQLSDGLLAKLSTANISSIETLVPDRAEKSCDGLYSKQATLLDEQMSSAKKIFRHEAQKGLETLHKQQSHEPNIDTAQTTAHIWELAAMMTAQSRALNNAIKNN